MPVELALPRDLRQRKWKVKIREKERMEPPHVSIIRGTSTWRISLRTGKFLDKMPDPGEVPEELLDYIRLGRRSANQTVWEWLCEQWDAKYPKNPISSNQ